MTLKKILAATLAAVLALSLAACGGKTAEETEPAVEDTTAAVEVVETETSALDLIEEESTDAVTEAASVEAAEDTTTTAAATEAATEAAEETTEAAKKVPETKQEIVDFYKAAATETDKGPVKTNFVMELKDMSGDGGFGAFAGAFEGIVRNTLAKKSTPGDSITGGYQKLTADDVASATATDDGKYTTVNIKLKEQTDGFKANSKEGHVGHGVTVLGDVQDAIDAMDGVSVDTSGGTVALRYNNASITAKIDNATGKIVSGTWKYSVNLDIKNITLKLGPIPVKVPGLYGQIDATTTR